LRPKFFSLVEGRQYSWEQEDHRELLRSMLMTASDIAASSKPWPVQERVARLVTAEFMVQGDKERTELNIQPQALMDRERQHELPQLQINWISDICLPLYQVCNGQCRSSPNSGSTGYLTSVYLFIRYVMGSVGALPTPDQLDIRHLSTSLSVAGPDEP
ncbi:hypothetical protein J6590_093461, partial [Homalodisca vitripennis]